MKELIIFSNINQFPLLRQLAIYGVNTVGYRVLNNSSILSYIETNTGNIIGKKVLDNTFKTYLYRSYLLEDSSYFKGSSYEDAKALLDTIDSIRSLITDNEEKEFKDKLTNNKLFKEKYEEIYKFYNKYISFLKNEKATDIINKTRELIKLNNKLDKEIIIIKGEDITPLTRKLINTCFKEVKEIELRDLFNVKQTKIDFKYLFKSNGYTHEVANVFKIIAENKLSLDKCTIVYTDYNNYYNSIKQYSSLLNIPVTYIDGVPSLEHNAYRMLYLINKLNDGLYGYDVLMNLIKDKSFNYNKLIKEINITNSINRFFEIVGDLKFTFDSKYNDQIYNNYILGNTKYLDEIKSFKDIFNKGLINLIKEYVIDDDPSITSKLINDLELYWSINGENDFDFIESILNTKVNGCLAKEGTISVCSIGKVKENIRENMFFIGNDNDSFHISLAENSYIADDKLSEFNSEFANTSINKAIKKREQYKEIIQLAFDLGSNVYISYSEKDETELKNHNFISLLYDLQKSSKPNLTFEEFKKTFEPINTYFGNSLRKEEKIIETYLDKTNSIAGVDIPVEKEKEIKNLIDKKYAPTQIEQNIKCKKRFLIEHILKIKQKENYDVFAKFANSDLGTMFHAAMEVVNEGKNKTEVLNEAKKIFDATCAKRNPILKYELEKDKEEFLDIVENGFNYLNKKQKGVAEKEIIKDLEINNHILHLKGYPDLVSNDQIIDFKAKRHIDHKEENSESCIQALIYALMVTNQIDHVEFYYPIFNKIIKTTYSESNTIEILNRFIDSLIKNDFIAAKDVCDDKKKLDQICEYCSFQDICGRKK